MSLGCEFIFHETSFAILTVAKIDLVNDRVSPPVCRFQNKPLKEDNSFLFP